MLKITAILLCASLMGCSALTATSALTDVITPDDGVSVEAQVGKENTKQIVGNQETTNNTVDGDQTTVTVTNEKIPFNVMVLMALGWLLPSPHEMWAGIVKLFKRGG